MAKKKNSKNAKSAKNTKSAKKNVKKNVNRSAVQTGSGGRAAAPAAALRRPEKIPAADFAASTPGIMMVSMIAVIFFSELLFGLDASAQVGLFRGAFRFFDYVTIAVGIAFLAYEGKQGKLDLALWDLRGRQKEGGKPSPGVNAWIELFFGLFLLCVIISTIVNGLDGPAAFGLPVRYIGIFNVFAFFLIYMKVSRYIKTDLFRRIILIGYLVVADLIALTALSNQYAGPIAAYQNKQGISAIFAQFNHYGYFIGMAVMIGIGCFVYEHGRLAVTGAVSALLNLIVLALNNTLGAQLAVAICTVGMTVLIAVSDRKNKPAFQKSIGTLGFLVLCVAAAVAAVPEVRTSVTTLFRDLGAILSGHSTGSEGTGRLMLWKEGVEYVRQKPLFGHGCERITLEMKERLGAGDVHSEPLTYAIYYGVPAMIFYLAGMVMVAVRYFRSRKTLPLTSRIAFLAASAYFLSSFVGVAMFYTAPFFFVFMGMGASTGDGSNEAA